LRFQLSYLIHGLVTWLLNHEHTLGKNRTVTPRDACLGKDIASLTAHHRWKLLLPFKCSECQPDVA
jgi:hypothetical protein